MSPWVIGFATLLALIIVYKLFKHVTGPSLPLPPGPKPWPIVGNIPHMGPVPHRALAGLARNHGPLMYLRMGLVDVVVASSATVAEQFLKVHDENFSSRPISSVGKYMSYNCQDFAFAPYGPRWRFFRKTCSVHMFSGKALHDFRHVRQEEVGKMIHSLASSSSKAVNLGQMLNVCTTNSLARVMIGRRVFNDNNGTYDPMADEFKSMVLDLMEMLGVFNLADFFPLLEGLDLQGVKAKVKKLLNRFDAFLTQIVEEHKIFKTEKHQDLLSTLLSLKEAPEDEHKLTDKGIKALLMLENGLDPKMLNMDEAARFTLQKAIPLCAHPRPRLSTHVYSSSLL
ncbi:hypothetical protein RJT34_33479 [Clitoria ternatea]|uniref:Flavonoid 3'-hydroxylase n=1 Tax=Clitoria ternatea TaxID=43366 RepID=A0AAN9I6V4_CLITE